MTSVLPVGQRPLYPFPRKSYSRIPDVLEVPNLVRVQTDSFRLFQEEGLKELFQEISPIQDFMGTRFELHFEDYQFRKPKYPENECRQREITYSAPLYVRVKLVVKETGEIKEQDIFMGDFPLMTDRGTFVINGAERVAVSQLVRSPGVYFTLDADVTSGRKFCFAKLIPERGAWLEFESSNKGVVSVKVDGKRKIPITTLLRAIGYGSDEKLIEKFRDVDTSPEYSFIRSTMERDPGVHNEKEALIEFYRRIRPGDPPTMDNARGLLNNLFFNYRRYSLGRVGRYKLNKRLGVDPSQTQRVLTKEDLVQIVRHIIMVNNSMDTPDDIDHLGNRRVRTVGELIQNQFRIGLLRMERVIMEHMSIVDAESVTPSALINVRPVVASMREFFGASQLSQFMDQTNPLAELTHKRRVSALGPGGLSRERAGFEVRDVHYSHYGRICPIETPEGPNIGLIGSLATYSVVDEYGLIETPYRRVIKEMSSTSPDLVGRKVAEKVSDAEGRGIVKAGAVLDAKAARKLAELPERMVQIVPFVSDDVVYFSADREEDFAVAQANEPLNERNEFVKERIDVRRKDRFYEERPGRVDLMDVSPKQIVSVSTSLIPFLEHDDANRALMGSNMQRQAVPLLCPEAPIIGTGMEKRVAYDSGLVTLAEADGEVTSVTAKTILVRGEDGQEYSHPLIKFARSNQGTCINQRPLVNRGDQVKRGQIMADSAATDRGELALGQNVLCAFMSWEGYNFEDAVVISESLLKEDKFTSIHIEKHEIEARDTKLGPEEITRDIPNVGEENLRNLDEQGIIRMGAAVKPGDILVGKITPKGETELTAEEKLLRAIFGEKAREVKDSSLRVPHGEWGTVIDVKVFSRENYSELGAGVNHLVRVWIAQRRKIAEGDKVAGRHGNKGVVSRILPVEDMPFLPDGRHVDLILNPISVPSRMNLGQVLETHLGWAAHTLSFYAMSPVFDGAANVAIEDALCRAWIARRSGSVSLDPETVSTPVDLEKAKAWLAERGYDGEKFFGDEHRGEAKRACLQLWLEDAGVSSTGLSDDALMAEAQQVSQKRVLPLPTSGKTTLYDGRTGEAFNQPITVGYVYIMKLIHLVEDKIHARSTGPYSLITQQPLGGKAQFGGQRFGEMEVWALEAYGAAHVLQEMLTIKSDDVAGRARAYEAILKGEDVLQPGVPESFKVLVKELQSLGLSVEVLNEEEEKVSLAEETAEFPRMRMNLPRFEER